MIFSIKDKKILNPSEVKAFFESLGDGKYRLSAIEISNRSINQNSRYWVVCELLVVPLRDLGWEISNKDDVHWMMKNQFLRERVQNGEKVFYRMKSTSKLSISEFNDYLMKVEKLAAELGIIL